MASAFSSCYPRSGLKEKVCTDTGDGHPSFCFGGGNDATVHVSRLAAMPYNKEGKLTRNMYLPAAGSTHPHIIGEAVPRDVTGST